jgi:hypothetical protein
MTSVLLTISESDTTDFSLPMALENGEKLPPIDSSRITHMLELYYYYECSNLKNQSLIDRLLAFSSCFYQYELPIYNETLTDRNLALIGSYIVTLSTVVDGIDVFPTIKFQRLENSDSITLQWGYEGGKPSRLMMITRRYDEDDRYEDVKFISK